MGDQKYILNEQFCLQIVEDSERKIKPQTTTISLFDSHLELKFKKYKNKRLDYYSIYRWIEGKDGETIKIEYISRKDRSYRLLTFLSEDGSAGDIADRLLDHCKFIADITKERERST